MYACTHTCTQVEGLLDKLVSRIIAAGGSDAPQQRRDMAYCLGELMLTEKSIKKLSETVATYKVRLRGSVTFRLLCIVSRFG